MDEQSATLDVACWKESWRCDHRQLNRFDRGNKDSSNGERLGEASGRYALLKKILSIIVTDAHQVVKRRLSRLNQSALDQKIFSRLSETLWKVNSPAQLAAAETLSGDGGWVLEDDKCRA